MAEMSLRSQLLLIFLRAFLFTGLMAGLTTGFLVAGFLVAGFLVAADSNLPEAGLFFVWLASFFARSFSNSALFIALLLGLENLDCPLNILNRDLIILGGK